MRRFLGRAVVWGLLSALAAGLFAAYRWSERERSRSVWNRPVTGASSGLVRLEKAPFQGYTNGRLSWTLQADLIELQRIPGGSLATVANATLTGIRDGALYDVPDDLKPALTTTPETAVPSVKQAVKKPAESPAEMPLFSSSRPKTPPAATFQARLGFYTLGEVEPLPPSLSALYTLQWRFKLVGDVDFRTRSGDRLRAETLTILELMNRRSWRVERRILCESGVRVTSKNGEALSNHAEYFPKDRTIECSGGVRGTSKDITVQTERLFWFLKEETIRCPETASGTLRGTPYSAEGLVIDLKRNRLHANSLSLKIPLDGTGEFALP